MASGVNTWREIEGFDGLWEGEYFIPIGFRARSVLFTLEDGSFAIISPGEPLLEEFKTRFKDKTVRYLVAPNTFHHMGLGAWKEAFPDAKIVACPEAADKIAKKSNQTVEDHKILQAELGEHQILVTARGTNLGETWLIQQAEHGTCWVVCDAFFNLAKVPKPFMMKMFIKLAQSAPGLRVSRMFKWLFLNNRKTYIDFVRHQLSTRPPSCLVVNHGQIARDDDLPNRIAAAMAEKFPY